MLTVRSEFEVAAMTNKTPPDKEENVACNVCLTEIPESVAVSSEADEYTQYFCGIECYDKWRDKEQPQESTENKNNK